MTTSPPPVARIVWAAMGPVLLGGLFAAVVWVFGFDWPPSITLAAGVVALFTLRRALGTGSDVGWRERPEGDDLAGARREVARLAWSMQGLEARVDRRSVTRLRSVAVARLADQGLDLDALDDEDACRRVLGEKAFATITAQPNQLPRFDAYVAAVGVIEQLTGEGARP